MIEVELHLYAYLRSYRPETGRGRPIQLTVEEKTAVGQVLDHLGIPKQARHVVFVNGVAQPEDYALSEGDRVAVFPPLAGGAVER